MKSRFLFLFVLFPLLVIAQETSIPVIDYPGSDIQNERVFHRNSLWGYMNGGADLYLEYGFLELRVTEFRIDSVNIKVEVFRMEDALMARGIYSVKAGGILNKEQNKAVTTNPYQVQRAVGPYYISIVNFTGSKKARQTCASIDRVVYRALFEEEVSSPEPPAGDEGPWFFFKGPLGASNCSITLRDLLEDIPEYQCWMLKPGKGQSQKAYLELSEEGETKVLERIKNRAEFSHRKAKGYLLLEWKSRVDKAGDFWE